MTEQELAAVLAHIRLGPKMQEFARLHFVEECSLSEAARRSGVARQNAHPNAKRIRQIIASQAAPPPAAPTVEAPAPPEPLPTDPLAIRDAYLALQPRQKAAADALYALEETDPEWDARASALDALTDQANKLAALLPPAPIQPAQPGPLVPPAPIADSPEIAALRAHSAEVDARYKAACTYLYTLPEGTAERAVQADVVFELFLESSQLEHQLIHLTSNNPHT